MRNLAIIAFIVLAGIQWWFAVRMIWQKEKVLTKGALYKFETEPVDPANPFKGKYIRLQFRASQANIRAVEIVATQPVYVSLSNNDSGFAIVKSVTVDPPTATDDYVKAVAGYVYDSVVEIQYPFEEFYMEESKAPKAEEIYREANRNNELTRNKTYALVRIWRGDAIIEDVIMNNRPIREMIK